MQGRIRFISLAEAKMRDDRNSRQGWKWIRWWSRGATETAAAEMWKIGDTMGTKKHIQDGECDGG